MFDSFFESMPRKEIEKLQLKRLKKALFSASKTPFYSKQFSENNISASSINTLSDIAKFPFTTKNDLRVSYPAGMCAVEKRDIVRMHASSGTTGKSTVIYYTSKDLDEWSSAVARGLYSAGIRKTDVFQNMMGYGLFTGGLGLHYGAEKIGCMIIPSSTGNSLKQIQLIQDFGTTAIHITPSYALHLADVISGEGINPADLGIKKAVLGAEPYSENTRNKIQEIYGLLAYNNYGLSEMNGPGVAFECEMMGGMHIWEDFYIVEIIDPDSGEILPDGEKGELVLTHINREAMPIIRYRTRDLTRIIPGDCPCGRTHRRIDRITGRTDDMLIISGVNIFPSQIESVLMNIPQVGNNYQIVVDRKDNLDKLTVRVELYSKMFSGDIKELDSLKRGITDLLKSTIIITPKIELLEPGSLPPSTGKAVRVIDNRKI